MFLIVIQIKHALMTALCQQVFIKLKKLRKVVVVVQVENALMAGRLTKFLKFRRPGD
jgi:hypothetical protein